MEESTDSPAPSGVRVPEVAVRDEPPHAPRESVFSVKDLSVRYGAAQAVKNVNLEIEAGAVTAFIGPSGCGKSTVLRCFDRLNDLIIGARVEGSILYHGEDLYGADVDRSRCGAVSAWSSRSRTRSRSRSTTTSPSARVCSA